MLRPAYTHPYATAQQPRRKGRKAEKAEEAKEAMLRPACAHPRATAQQPWRKRLKRPKKLKRHNQSNSKKLFLEMHNVIVIFTRHDSYGMCNSDELLKILWSIQPDVIFEEIGHEAYDLIYVQQIRTKLESTAIMLYQFTKDVEYLPVDTLVLLDDYYSGQNQLADELEKHFHKSDGLKRAFYQLRDQSQVGGFPFLNSDRNDAIHDEIEKEEISILAELGDDNLNQIVALRNEVNSKRDEEMIENIYKYGEQQEFQKAIFLIGAGHRRSIKSKLDKIEPRYGVEIKWHFLAGKDLG